MNTEERIAKQKELIEEMGRYFDKEGFQPIAGRILGLLMVMDKEQFTFEEITEELQISKSSASNALRNLEIRESIEYVTLPGDRKRYFQLKRIEPIVIIETFEKKMLSMQQHFGYILELKADKNSRNAIFLNKLTVVIRDLLNIMNATKQKYNSTE